MTDIYYFTGSGNSLGLAKDLAEGLDARLIPMSFANGMDEIKIKAENIGFVFPNHDFQAPVFVQNFINRLTGLEDKYLFAVCNYGLSAGKALKKLDKLLGKRGGRLFAGFAVIMPHNGIGSRLQDEETRKGFLECWDQHKAKIIDTFKNKKESKLESASAIGGFFRNKAGKMLSGLFRFIEIIIRKGAKGLEYVADDNCNGCAVCEKVCPVGNIEIKDERPFWGEKCVNCFACLHWCPQKSVSLGGNDLRIDRGYHHPNVKLTDMINKKPASL